MVFYLFGLLDSVELTSLIFPQYENLLNQTNHIYECEFILDPSLILTKRLVKVFLP